MSTNNFLEIKNISRYSDLYLNEKNEEITLFDPMMYLEYFKDYYQEFKNSFNICNREPVCDCKDICNCDQDSYSEINIRCNIVSNCKCNLDIILSEQKFKLNNDFLWNIFILDDECEKSVIHISPLDNTVIFNLPIYDNKVVFKPDDKMKLNKDGIISTQFDYMSFSEF